MAVGPARIKTVGASLHRFMASLYAGLDAAGASDSELLDRRLRRIEADLAALRRDLDGADHAEEQVQ